MKRLGIAILAVVLLWLGVAAMYGSVIFFDKLSVRSKTSDFLQAVQAGNAAGVRLLDYGKVKAEYDDGCVCTGHAELTIEAQGQPMTVPAVFTVGEDGPNQICAITPSGIERGSVPELAAWNQAFCGGGSF